MLQKGKIKKIKPIKLSLSILRGKMRKTKNRSKQI